MKKGRAQKNFAGRVVVPNSGPDGFFCVSFFYFKNLKSFSLRRCWHIARCALRIRARQMGELAHTDGWH